MTTFIDIIEPRKIKDSSGFVTVHDVVLASVRAYKEERHASRAWANRAAFSKATVIFQFRKIPNLGIKADYVIVCDNYGDGYKNITRNKIRYNSNGDAYFVRNGHRWHLDQFMRV